MAAPELWDDQARAADILRERASLIQATEEYEARRQQLEDLELMLDMALEEEDHQTLKEVVRDLTAMERDFSDWELKLLLGAEDDDKNAIVTIHAGAGGTEAQDWAEILLRMYLRYAERKGFKTETIDLLARGRGRGQERHLHRQRPLRQRFSEERKRHPPPGAHLAV